MVQDERAQAFNREIVLRETRHGHVLKLTAKLRVRFRHPDMFFPRRTLSIGFLYRAKAAALLTASRSPASIFV
ncbi:MAG: hypothetical protein ACLQFI_12760 [Methylocella sp.]